MLKFIMNAFRPVKGKCRKEYVRVQTIHGDMINHLNARSLWKCNCCGKTVTSKELTRVL